MLYKKELKGIPPCEIGKNLTKAESGYHFLAVAKVEKTKRCGEILIVDYYDTSDKKLQVRFFASAENQQYITYVPSTEKWETIALGVVLKRIAKGISRTKSSQKTNTLIKSVLKPDHETVYFVGNTYVDCEGAVGICEAFCERIRKERNHKRNEKKRQREEELRSYFSEILFEPIKQYAVNNAFDHGYVFFSNLNKRRERKGYCTCCRKRFTVKDPVKHKMKSQCPKCGRNIFYWADRYFSSISDKGGLWYADRKDDKVLLQYFNIERYFCVDHSPHLCCTPVSRTVMDTEMQTYWSSYLTSSMYYYGWNWTTFVKSLPDRDKYGTVYPDNLDMVFGNKWHNMNLKSLFSQYKDKVNLVQLLRKISQFPVVEYLCKMGLTTFVSKIDPRTLNLSGTNFEEVMGVSKQYLPLYREIGITPDEHSIIVQNKGFTTAEQIQRLRETKISTWQYDRILTCLEYMTLNKFLNYYSKQCLLDKKDFDRPLVHLSDYISMCEEYGIRITKRNLFPKDIKSAHDMLLKKLEPLRKEKTEKLASNATALMYSLFKRYIKDNLIIVIPVDRIDFIREGQELSHCVGSSQYYENHMKGSRMIFFIRSVQVPNEAFYTAEINMLQFTVLQCYGYGDCVAPPKVKQFIRGFARYLKTHQNKEINYAEDLRTEKAS